MLIAQDIVKLIPNQSEAVKKLGRAVQASSPRPAVEDILGLAETVYVANQELNMRYLEEFYREVALIRRAGQHASSRKSAKS